MRTDEKEDARDQKGQLLQEEAELEAGYAVSGGHHPVLKQRKLPLNWMESPLKERSDDPEPSHAHGHDHAWVWNQGT